MAKETTTVLVYQEVYFELPSQKKCVLREEPKPAERMLEIIPYTTKKTTHDDLVKTEDRQTVDDRLPLLVILVIYILLLLKGEPARTVIH